jgi:hypothetical protein
LMHFLVHGQDEGIYEDKIGRFGHMLTFLTLIN